QRALPRLHRYADRPGRAPRGNRRAADGAVVRRCGGAAGTERSGVGRCVGRAAESRAPVPVPQSPRAAVSPRGRGWGAEPPPALHIWHTLGYRGIEQADGRSMIEWVATPDYCFHAPSGPIVHGGMVTTLLDTAMGGAC